MTYWVSWLVFICIPVIKISRKQCIHEIVFFSTFLKFFCMMETQLETHTLLTIQFRNTNQPIKPVFGFWEEAGVSREKPTQKNDQDSNLAG